MPHENSERARGYRERARALRSIAEQTENRPTRAALKGVAADYDLMAFKLGTKGYPHGQSQPFPRTSDQTPQARWQSLIRQRKA
jgi:hypothetical protein